MAEEKKIKNMIAFIEAEAREKAAEIEQLAQEEYDIEKQQLVEKGKATARQEAEESKKKLDIERRVTHANHLKKQNLNLLRERETQLEKLKESVQKKCEALTQNATEYRDLLCKLVVQALQNIQSDVEVQCREKDSAHVEAVLVNAVDQYQKKSKKTVHVTLSRKYLADDIWGGIVALGLGGKITCDCTLKQRANVCFEEQLPTIRHMLFN